MLVRLLLITVVLFGFTAAHPQEPSDAGELIEEIIVTATKRESPLQATALSVGVLTGKDIEQSGVLNVNDFWRSVPSLTVTDQGFGGNRITIRGLGEEPNGISESMSAVYFDETPINQADGLFTMSPDFNYVDIQRIEVLRGPQGTLFGASSMGGALRIITHEPVIGRRHGLLEGIVSATAHGGDNFEGSIVYNQPMGEAAAGRFVGYFRDNDGFIDDIGLGKNDINSDRTAGIRASILADLNDRLSILGRLVYQSRDAGGFNFVDPNGKPSLGLATSGDYEVALLSDQYRDTDATVGSLTVEYASSWSDWTFISSWVRYDMDLQIDLAEEAQFILGDYAALYSTTDYEQEAFVQELRVASKPGSAIGWLVGLFYLDQDLPREDEFFLDGGSVQIQNSDDSRRDFALFGEVSVPLGEDVMATAGARWFDVSKRQSSLLNGISTGFTDVFTNTSYDEDGVTPKLSIDWTVNEALMLYALASKGYRAGGANTPLAVSLCGAPTGYDSDDLWNYEAGIKSSLLNGRMMLNASAFTIDWSEAQAEVDVPTCNDVYVINAGEASSDGVELEILARLMASWDLRFAVGFNRSEVDKTVPNSGIPAGAEIPLVPELTAAIASTNRFSFMGRHEGFFRIDWQYTAETETSLFPQFNVTQDDYHLVNLRLGAHSGRWTTTLFADNVFDEQASLLCCRIDGGYSINRPRTVGLRVSFRME